MRHTLPRFAKPLVAAAIAVFGIVWIIGPPASAKPLASQRFGPTTFALLATTGAIAPAQATVTPTPTDDPTFPTITPTPTDDPTFPTEAPIPTDDVPFPTITPDLFPTNDPYPFPTDDPYPFPTDDPYPFPSPSPTRTAIPSPDPATTATPRPTSNPYPFPTNEPTPTPRRAERDESASISVVQRPSPNRVSSAGDVDVAAMADVLPDKRDDGLIDNSFVITNRGAGDATDVVVTLPYDPRFLRILDATFTSSNAYVSRIATNTTPATVEFHTGPPAPGASVSASIVLLVRPATPAGASLSQRATYTWSDDVSGGTGRTNLPLLIAGPSDDDQATYPLALTRTAPNVYTASATVFAPGEPVALWYNTPAGRAVAIGTVQADANGGITTSFDASNLDDGTYSFIAAGTWTQFTATAAFNLIP